MQPTNMLVVVNGLRSVVAYVFLCLYVAIVGPPALAVAFLTGRAQHVLALGQFGARSVRQMLGIRLRTEGLEHVDGRRPAVYCINHRSNVDVVAFEVLFSRCPRLRGLYKAEMGKLPILGRALRLVGFVPVDRGHRSRPSRRWTRPPRGWRRETRSCWPQREPAGTVTSFSHSRRAGSSWRSKPRSPWCRSS